MAGAGSMLCQFPTRQAVPRRFVVIFSARRTAENTVITEAALRPGRAIDNRPRTPSYRHVAPANADHFFSVITVFSSVLRAEKTGRPCHSRSLVFGRGFHKNFAADQQGARR
jgi:hypothetical protein